MANDPAIILVRPQIGENIGAAARVMLNFGLTDLRIIAPRDGWPNEKATNMAKKAVSVIENAKIYDNLTDACHDITKLYATSARQRYMIKPEFSAKHCIEDIINFGESNKSAIMFGQENNGLSNEDINLADAIVTIDVAPIYSSINLAQAVAIICYECYINNNKQNIEDSKTRLGNAKLANKQELAGLMKHLSEELDQTNFFQEASKHKKMLININNIFARANLTDQEIRTLHGVISALKK